MRLIVEHYCVPAGPHNVHTQIAERTNAMKILYFSRDYTTHDHRFLASLANAGHQLFFLRLEKLGVELEDRPLPPNVTAVHWAGGRRPFTFSQIPHLLASLHGVLRDVRPDLVHAGPIQTAGLLTALSGFHPFVAVSWGSDLLRDADRSSLWRWATRYTLRRGDVLIGDCNPVREKAVALGMDPDADRHLPLGGRYRAIFPARSARSQALARMPETPTDPAELRARLGWENAFVLLSTRAWEPGYGVDELARAFVRAARARPELRLLLLGGGSSGAPAAADLSAGERARPRPLRRPGQPARAAPLLSRRRRLRQRFAQRRDLDFAAGSAGHRAARPGL